MSDLSKRDLLMIAYIFPPLAGAGVYRTLKFAKYLPELAVRPTVLCAEDPDWYMLDETGELAAQIPDDVTVHRIAPTQGLVHLKHVYRGVRQLGAARPPAPARPGPEAVAAAGTRTSGLKRRMLDRFAIPDEQRFWIKPATRRALEIAQDLPRRSCIYSSVPPFSAHLVALEVKRRTGLPWIADFRDAWAGNPVLMRGLSGTVRARHAQLEARVVAEADAVLAVAPGVAESLRRAHPSAAEKIVLLTNGFDPEDLAGLEGPPPTDRFVIAHVGELSRTRVPAAFLEALGRVRVSRPGASIEARFIGYRDPAVAAEMARLVAANCLGDAIVVRGAVPHAEALKAMREAHVLLMQSAFGTTDSPIGQTYPGKLFEYMASGRPVLAVVPDGATAKLIDDTGCGWWREPGDVAGVTSLLESLVDRWRAGTPLLEGTPDMARFDRRTLTAELAEIVGRLAAGAV